MISLSSFANMQHKKGIAFDLTLIIAIVSGIIGLAVVNSLTATTNSPLMSTQGSLNWTPGTYTLSPCDKGLTTVEPVLTNATSGTALVKDTHYSHVSESCVLKNLSVVVGSYLFNVTYQYIPSSAFSSSLSRDISGYVVPIGMLGILGLVAYMALMR